MWKRKYATPRVAAVVSEVASDDNVRKQWWNKQTENGGTNKA